MPRRAGGVHLVFFTTEALERGSGNSFSVIGDD